MKNHLNIKKQLQKELSVLNLAAVYPLLKEMEVLLQENIAIDEALLEKGKPLVCVDVNETIKEIIFNAYVEIHMRTSMNEDWKPLKVYLDDKRSTPDGYVRAFWPKHVEEFLTQFKIQEVSLDHDLGDDDTGTGYDVVCYLEEKVYFDRSYDLPEIKTHTDNSSAREKMWRGINNILFMQKK